MMVADLTYRSWVTRIGGGEAKSALFLPRVDEVGDSVVGGVVEGVVEDSLQLALGYTGVQISRQQYHCRKYLVALVSEER